MKNIVKIMFFLFFLSFSNVFSQNINIKTQNELKKIIKTNQNQKKEYSKKILNSIYYYSLKLSNAQETIKFFLKLTNNNKYRALHPFIYYLLSKYKQNNEKKNLLIKSLKHSKSIDDISFSYKKLYEYFKYSEDKERDIYRFYYLNKLLYIHENSNNKKELEKIYYEIGSFYRDKIDYIKSINYFAKSISMSKSIKGKLLGDSFLQIAKILNNIGNENLKKIFILKALKQSKINNSIQLKGNIYYFLSDDYYYKNNFFRSYKYILRAESILESNPSQIKNVLFLKSKILIKINKKKEAEIILKNLIYEELKKNKYHGLLHIISFYTNLLIEDNKLEEVEKLINIIDDIYAPYYKYYYFYYYIKARYFEKIKNIKKATKYYDNVINSINKVFKEFPVNKHFRLQEEINQIYMKIGLFYINNKIKNYIKKVIYINENKNIFSNKIIIRNKKALLRIKEIKKIFNSLQPEMNENIDFNQIEQIGLDFIYNYKKKTRRNINIKRIQNKIHKNEMIIKYIILENSLFILNITKNKTNSIYLKNIIPHLRKRIFLFSKYLEDFSNGNVDFLRVKFNTDIAKYLYNTLLKASLNKFPNINRLLILPDGILFKIPFESLIYGNNNIKINKNIIYEKYIQYKYLIQKYSVSYYFSLFQFYNNPSSINKNKKYKIMFFGNPFISEKLKLLFNPLPSISNVLNSLKKIFKNKIISFTGKEFTITNFKKFSNKTSIIHIATHYIKNKKFPYFSSLLFTKNKNSSDYLYAKDIYNYNLNNNLVVLSACESSENNLISIQGFKGFIDSFKQAGTKSLIVSLWPVDEYNSSLLQLFYKYLNKNPYISKRNISKSLQLAKIEFINKIKIMNSKIKLSYSNPFLWSNFVIYNLN